MSSEAFLSYWFVLGSESTVPHQRFTEAQEGGRAQRKHKDQIRSMKWQFRRVGDSGTSYLSAKLGASHGPGSLYLSLSCLQGGWYNSSYRWCHDLTQKHISGVERKRSS